MKRFFLGMSWLCLAVALGCSNIAAAAPMKPRAVRIAIITFFSGSGAVVSGPSVDSAKLAVEEINRAGGIDGVPIEARYIDESGGPAKNIAEVRALAGHVDAIVGFVSSGDCLAVAPVVEQLKVLTLFTDCTTDSLFAGHAYRYVFRTQPPASANALSAAYYVMKTHPGIRSIAGINQDYAFGRDQWKYFSLAMRTLKPGIRVEQPLFTKLFSGQYESQISRLLAERPDLIYCSFWGGDLVAFLQQARAQGLFKRSLVVFSLGTQGGPEGSRALPGGVIVGSEHSYLFHPGPIERPALKQFVDAYHKAFGRYPITTYSFTLHRAVMALAAAYKSAYAADHGRHWPTTLDLADALSGMTLATPLGPLVIRTDHQATYGEEYGTAVHTAQYPFAVFNHVITFPPDLIVAPEGTADVADWIEKQAPRLYLSVPAPKVYDLK